MIVDTHSTPLDFEIPNDGFFPSIQARDFQEIMRVPADLAPKLIRSALVQGLIQVNAELDEFRRERVEQGYQSLRDVPQVTVGQGESEYRELVDLYDQAVFSRAMAILHPSLIGLMAREEAMEYASKTEKNERAYLDRTAELIERIQGNLKGRKRKPYGSIFV